MKNNTAVDQTRLKAMNDCVSHRGPDSEGFYQSGSAGFGHRRLSILDLSERGAQPMRYADYVITFNGEVYNYLEVRETLKAKGYSFSSGSDTEVILAAYQEYGQDCVHHFNGMWAFAIHDIRKNLVFISRDRFGVKPLYYWEDPTRFLFSSEIRQILTQVGERRVNKQMLFDYLFLGYHHHTDNTFFAGITSLDPGHNILFDLTNGSYTRTQWYTLKVNDKVRAMPFDEAQKLFKETLDRAIHLRLRSDVKVGTCLSGGLDSSYIASVAAAAYHASAKEKFIAITAKSIEKEKDETPFAEQVAKNAGLNWKVTFPQKADFLKVVEDVIETQEEPFGGPSIIMQYFVMQKAKKEGCIVLLDGQGGDEALLGYDRYYAAYLNQQKGIVQKVKSFFNVTGHSNLSIKGLLLYMLYFNMSRVRAMRQVRRNNFIKSEFKSYLNKKLLEQIAKAGRNITELQKLEITRIQLQKLLKYEDRNSMRFSVEARVPFVDYNVMELGFSLPFSFKMHKGWSKYILRKSAETELPQEIVWRSNKLGFEAPTKSWLSDKSGFLEVIRQSSFLEPFIDKHKISPNIDDISLWKLYNVAVWADKFKVQF